MARLPRPKIGRKHKPIRRSLLTDNGVNEGGSCLSCGGSIFLWYHYQLCDRCLLNTHVDTPTVSK